MLSSLVALVVLEVEVVEAGWQLVWGTRGIADYMLHTTDVQCKYKCKHGWW